MSQVGHWLDMESVRHYQVVAYLAYICAGIQALAFGAPPNAVEQAMGRGVGLVWTVMLIACPAMALAGRWIHGSPAGLWLQIAGGAGVAFATAAYAVSIMQSTWFEQATFSAWVALALTVCSVAILARDIRRVHLAGQLVQRMDAADE